MKPQEYLPHYFLKDERWFYVKALDAYFFRKQWLYTMFPLTSPMRLCRMIRLLFPLARTYRKQYNKDFRAGTYWKIPAQEFKEKNKPTQSFC
jgi:hypothetical protein